MASRAPFGVNSGLSRSSAAAGPSSRRVGRDVRNARHGREVPQTPFGPDGTDRPLHRPTAPEAPQESSRGQKKGHTLNNLLVSTETGPLGVFSHTGEGKAADKRLAAEAGDSLPPGSCLDQEKGLQGFFQTGSTLFQPTKTPRGGELTPPEKATHRRISSRRVRLEHAMGGVKRYRSVKDQIRLLKEGIRDAVMETCCGLHNFRLQYRPWNYSS
jgi:DDE superfamily endonuclease